MRVIWILIGIYAVLVFLANNRVVFKAGNRTVSIQWVITALFLFGAIILMTANRTGYDADAYTRFFNVSKQLGRNPYDYTYQMLFNVEMVFLRFLPELTYPEFHAIILAISFLAIIMPLLKHYADNIPVVFSLYAMSGTIAQDGLQFKNFIAVSFLMLGFYFLFDSDRKRRILLYIICVVIASLFHFSFVIYLIFLLAESEKFNRISIYLPRIGLILYFVALLGENSALSGLIRAFSKISFLSKASFYESSHAGIRSIVPVFIYFVILFTLEYLNQNRENISEKTAVLAGKVVYIWRIMGILLPLLVIANALYRLYRNLYIIIFLIFANIVLELPNKSSTRWLGALVVFGTCFTIFFYPVLLRAAVDSYDPIIHGFYFWEP